MGNDPTTRHLLIAGLIVAFGFFMSGASLPPAIAVMMILLSLGFFTLAAFNTFRPKKSVAPPQTQKEITKPALYPIEIPVERGSQGPQRPPWEIDPLTPAITPAFTLEPDVEHTSLIDWPKTAPSDAFLGAQPTQNTEAQSDRLAEAENALSRREEALRSTQGEVHTLETQVLELEMRVKEQGQSLFETRFQHKKMEADLRQQLEERRKESGLNTQGALDERQQLWDENRLTLSIQIQTLEEQLQDTDAKNLTLTEKLEQASKDMGGDQAQLKALQAGETQLQKTLKQEKDTSLQLRETLEELEVQGASKAASLNADRSALEAGRASLQREVEALSREVSQLKRRLETRKNDKDVDPRIQLLEALEQAAVPALFIGEEGLIAGITSPLTQILDVNEEAVLGMDTWSFTRGPLSALVKDSDALQNQQAALLDGVENVTFDPIPLKDGTLLHRWVHPLKNGDGQMELFASALPGGQKNHTPELLQALDMLKHAAGQTALPSSLTTLEALGRQLDEMARLLPTGEGGLEARARLSTARALVKSLINLGPSAFDGEGAASDLARRVLDPLQSILGQA